MIGFRPNAPTSLFNTGDVPTLLVSDPRRGGDGAMRINPEKSRAKWRWIAATSQNATPFVVKASSGSFFTFRQAGLDVNPQGGDDQGFFEVAAILSNATFGGVAGRIAIQPQIKSPTLSRYLSNVPVSNFLMSGNSQLPGLLPQTIFCMPDSSFDFAIQNLNTTTDASVQIALWGRQFVGCGKEYALRLMRRAQTLKSVHPYWIGPQDPSDESSGTGPTINLPPGRSTILTFPIPSDADFLMVRPLDDSTNSAGTEPKLFAQITENSTQRGLIDLTGLLTPPATFTNLGMSWRSLVAACSSAVTGWSGGEVRAFALSAAVRGWTHLIPRNTQVTIRFTSTETANTITLRPALFGYSVYGQQTVSQTSIDGQAMRERVAQGREFLRRMGLTSGFGEA